MRPFEIYIQKPSPLIGTQIQILSPCIHSLKAEKKTPDARFSRIKMYIGVAIGVDVTVGHLCQCQRRRLAHDSPTQVVPTGGTLGIGGELDNCCHLARPFGTRSDKMGCRMLE